MWVGQSTGGNPDPDRNRVRAMEQLYLAALVLAIVVLMVALARILVRPRSPAGKVAVESPFAVSSEGMKVCPKCGMGNLWTESRCISCAAALRG